MKLETSFASAPPTTTRAMETYDAFVARLGGGTGGVTGIPREVATSGAPSTPLATVAETYDAYSSLHRSGLWFDLNPKWHSELNCYYLRCEPNRTGNGHVDAASESPKEEPPRTRTVFVPVASSRQGLSHRVLRKLVSLGGEWRSETIRSEGSQRVDGTRATDQIDGEGTGENLVFTGDPLCAITTSLAIVDSDGTTVVVRIAHGLIEPEDCEKKTDGELDDEDADGKPTQANVPAHFSDDEQELDAGDIWEVV